MSLDAVALATSDALGIILVAKLSWLRLHHVYKVFSAYVVFVLLSSSLVYLQFRTVFLDYRVLYLVIAAGTWILTFWMVYASLTAVLAKLPGILRFSRRLLSGVFGVALVLSLLLARSGFTSAEKAYPGWSLDSGVAMTLVGERVMTTVFLLALLSIQGFVLWFPVRLPRNLVLFTAGFAFNFVIETTLLVLRGVLPPQAAAIIDPMNLFVLSICFAYFAIVITRRGEQVPVVIGHKWHPQQQQRLVHRLEEINEALLKNSRKTPPAA